MNVTDLITFDAGENILLRIISASRTVNKIDTDFLHLSRKEDTLLDAPVLPTTIIRALRTITPLRGANAHKHWLFPDLATAFEKTKGETEPVLKGLATILVRPAI